MNTREGGCYERYYINWFYSFWNRRYTEGTFEVTYNILKEIEKHYSAEYEKLLLGKKEEREEPR